MLIRVGVGHPLSDVRGYAYEHRLIASRTIGRWVLPTEQVHHKNEIQTDNRPENLEVMGSVAEHRERHRKKNVGLRMPGEDNPKLFCACGCGGSFLKFDECNRPRKYISGHNPQLGELSQMILAYLEFVPEPCNSPFIASFFGVNRKQVTTTLSRLRAKGLVERRGTDWRCCG